MNNLLARARSTHEDFLQRVDLLGDSDSPSLISNYSEYYRLTSYFRRYTKEMIGVVMGINNLLEIFNEKYYEHLEGGILESVRPVVPQRRQTLHLSDAAGGVWALSEHDEREPRRTGRHHRCPIS